MSWLDIIKGFGTGIVDMVRGTRAPKPKPYNRPHVWRAWKLRRAGNEPGELVRLEPPICDYCQQEQTLSNEFRPCPGPTVHA